jgi:hypothetical protein
VSGSWRTSTKLIATCSTRSFDAREVTVLLWRLALSHIESAPHRIPGENLPKLRFSSQILHSRGLPSSFHNWIVPQIV